MLYHAVRASKRTLLTRASSPEPAKILPASPFAAALQVAAARAWTRTVVRNFRNVPPATSVILGEENTTPVKELLPGVPPDSDPENRLNGQRAPPFACAGYYTALETY